MQSLNINGLEYSVDASEDMPLLWVLRDILNFTGTKFGCGIMVCGACTVLIDGVATRTCMTPCGLAMNKKVQTIEGLSQDPVGRALQSAWIEKQVPQCGYCQSGMLMACTALLKQNTRPSDQDIDAAISNLCRCGTYQRVRAGVHLAAALLAGVKTAAT